MLNITLRMLGLFVNEWPEADGNMIWRFQRQGMKTGWEKKSVGNEGH
jgi:hypothetical protein